VRITIEGRSYALGAANQASLAVLLALKRASGLSLKDVQAGIGRLQEIGNDESLSTDERGVEAMSDESCLLALGALIFIARWQAGERLGFEEACDFPLNGLSLESEPGDPTEEEPAPDPI
jgi:hypothetical protein